MEHTHVFTHKKWHVEVYFFEVKDVEEEQGEPWKWFVRDEWSDLPWAGPHGKFTGIAP